VEAGTGRPSPSWAEGMFAGSSPVVDTNDRCVGLVKCAVRRGEGVVMLHMGGKIKIRPSSVVMLYVCISSSIASLIILSMYPVLADKSLVSCSLILW
jgi:hypothetical protein